jgi:hypothetical protein
MELSTSQIPLNGLKVDGIDALGPKIASFPKNGVLEMHNGTHLTSDDERISFHGTGEESMISPLSSRTGRNGVDDSRSSNDLEEASFEGGYLYHHDHELSAGEGDDDEEEEEDDGREYDEEFEGELDYADEEADLMELEDNDDPDEEEEEEEEEKDDLDEEEDDDEHQGDEEESKSDGSLARQLHEALQELSETHSNVRYINRTYPRSPTDEMMLASTTTLPTTRRRSISSSLSSLVSGIRRVAATDRNPNPIPRRGIASVTHPSNQSRSQLGTRMASSGVAGGPRRAYRRDTEEEDDESSSPILWRSSLPERQELVSPTEKLSPIHISSLLTGELISNSSPPRPRC